MLRITRLALAVPLLLVSSLALAGDDVPTLDWEDLFSSIGVKGAVFSEKAKALEGKRVLFRGYAVQEPVPPGGLYVTRVPVERLHPDDEETLPWDSVAVLWRPGTELPPIPRRPTVEGTLRLGNRKVGSESVTIALQDAAPHLPVQSVAPTTRPGS